MLVVVRRQRRPRRLVALGAAPLVGVVVQAVLGGITVRTHLHPATVAAHFLVSAAVIALSTLLVRRMGEPDGPAVPSTVRELRWLTWGLSAVTALLFGLAPALQHTPRHMTL